MHSQHGELPEKISSDQDLMTTILNLQVLSPVWGNKTCQQLPFQRRCHVFSLNSPCHLPIPACHPSADAFPCAHITAAPGYNPGLRLLSCLLSFTNCPLLSFQSPLRGFHWHFIAIWRRNLLVAFSHSDVCCTAISFWYEKEGTS